MSNVTVNTSVDTVRRSRGSAGSGLAGAADCGGTAGLLAAEAGPGTVLTGTLAARLGPFALAGAVAELGKKVAL